MARAKCWRISGRKLNASRRFYSKAQAKKVAKSLARMLGKRKAYKVVRAACPEDRRLPAPLANRWVHLSRRAYGCGR
jgi:hypothetical protein